MSSRETPTPLLQLLPIGLLLLNLLLAGGIAVVVNNLPVPLFLPCTYPFALALLLGLGIMLALNILAAGILGKPWLARSWLSFIALAVLGMLALWLGSYRYSPLTFSQESILRGFQITQQGRNDEFISSGAILVLQAGVPIGISVMPPAPNARCLWSSLNGGIWDEPGSCDTVYKAPVAEFDLLTVRVYPGCNLPPARGQIRISILP
jgi:hypothetical protein